MRTLIINGGNISNDFASVYIKNNRFDKIIAVDGGLSFANSMNIIPDYIVGDFDTVPKFILDQYEGKSEIIRFNPEKDNTDSDLAIRLACDIGSSEIVIIGATGRRIDHTIANIELLTIPLKAGIQAYIIDEYNKLYLIDGIHCIERQDMYGKYISLIPLTEYVKGLTLTGFKYSLKDYTYKYGSSLGVSNELKDEHGYIQLSEGILIVMETKD